MQSSIQNGRILQKKKLRHRYLPVIGHLRHPVRRGIEHRGLLVAVSRLGHLSEVSAELLREHELEEHAAAEVEDAVRVVDVHEVPPVFRLEEQDSL